MIKGNTINPNVEGYEVSIRESKKLGKTTSGRWLGRVELWGCDGNTIRTVDTLGYVFKL